MIFAVTKPFPHTGNIAGSFYGMTAALLGATEYGEFDRLAMSLIRANTSIDALEAAQEMRRGFDAFLKRAT